MQKSMGEDISSNVVFAPHTDIANNQYNFFLRQNTGNKKETYYKKPKQVPHQ
jgi:hypothetical protein